MVPPGIALPMGKGSRIYYPGTHLDSMLFWKGGFGFEGLTGFGFEPCWICPPLYPGMKNGTHDNTTLHHNIHKEAAFTDAET